MFYQTLFEIGDHKTFYALVTKYFREYYVAYIPLFCYETSKQ